MKRYLIVFDIDFETKKEAKERLKELEEETGYSFHILEAMYVKETTSKLKIKHLPKETT